jgi:hypothetical protein
LYCALYFLRLKNISRFQGVFLHFSLNTGFKWPLFIKPSMEIYLYWADYLVPGYMFALLVYVRPHVKIVLLLTYKNKTVKCNILKCLVHLSEYKKKYIYSQLHFWKSKSWNKQQNNCHLTNLKNKVFYEIQISPQPVKELHTF